MELLKHARIQGFNQKVQAAKVLK